MHFPMHIVEPSIGAREGVFLGAFDVARQAAAVDLLYPFGYLGNTS